MSRKENFNQLRAEQLYIPDFARSPKKHKFLQTVAIGNSHSSRFAPFNRSFKKHNLITRQKEINRAFSLRPKPS